MPKEELQVIKLSFLSPLKRTFAIRLGINPQADLNEALILKREGRREKGVNHQKLGVFKSGEKVAI